MYSLHKEAREDGLATQLFHPVPQGYAAEAWCRVGSSHLWVMLLCPPQQAHEASPVCPNDIAAAVAAAAVGPEGACLHAAEARLCLASVSNFDPPAADELQIELSVPELACSLLWMCTEQWVSAPGRDAHVGLRPTCHHQDPC